MHLKFIQQTILNSAKKNNKHQICKNTLHKNHEQVISYTYIIK